MTAGLTWELTPLELCLTAIHLSVVKATRDQVTHSRPIPKSGN